MSYLEEFLGSHSASGSHKLLNTSQCFVGGSRIGLEMFSIKGTDHELSGKQEPGMGGAWEGPQLPPPSAQASRLCAGQRRAPLECLVQLAAPGGGDDGTAVSLQGWQVGVGPSWPVCQGLAPSSKDSVMKRAKERPGTGRGAGKQRGHLSKQLPGLARSSASLLPRRQASGFPGSGHEIGGAGEWV